MRDRPVIYIGLAAFLLLFTFPVWRNLSARATTLGPRQAIPKGQTECVAPLAYMRASHMTLLMDWRDQVVRSGLREFQAYNGKKYTRSLTATCLEQCHGTRVDFCDRCHNYAAVSVSCWNCHLDAPRNKLQARRTAR